MRNIAISPEDCDHELSVDDAKDLVDELQQLIDAAAWEGVTIPEPDLTGGLIDRDGFEAVLLRSYSTPRSAKVHATRTWNNIVRHPDGAFKPYLRCRDTDILAEHCRNRNHRCRVGLDFQRLARDFRWPCSCYGFKRLYLSGEGNIRFVLKYALNASN